MGRSKSSHQWLKSHFDDEFVKRAQREGYRSRAVYKLEEIQRKDRLLKPGTTLVDLGAAPGGWSQYAAQLLKGSGRIIALDILPMEPLAGVEFLQGDFREEAVYARLLGMLASNEVDQSHTGLQEVILALDFLELVDGARAVTLALRALYKLVVEMGFEPLMAALASAHAG